MELTTQSRKFKYMALVLTVLVLIVTILTINRIKVLQQVPAVPSSEVGYTIHFEGPIQIFDNAYVHVNRQERLVQQWQELNLPGYAPTVDFEHSVVVFICESYRATPSDLKLKYILLQEGTILIHFQLNQHKEEEEGIPQALVLAIHETQMPIELYRVVYFEWEQIASQRIVLVSD